MSLLPRPARAVLVLAVVWAAAAGAQQPAPAERDSAALRPLFASDDAIALTVELPLRPLRGDRGQDSPEREAVAVFPGPGGELMRVDVQIRTRGRFRLQRQICDFPPLRLNLPRSQVQNTVFDGQDKLKLVTHCRDRDLAFQQYVLQEYLAYRLYNILTEASFRVRLAWVTYVDSEGRRDPMSRYAFFIEDVDDMAARNGWDVLEVRNVHPYDLRASQLRMLEVFHYMIGNTDWSVVAPERGKDYCCHNGRVIGNMRGVALPVPYDFDLAGVVDARYARPAPDLEIRYVRERLFRGFCSPREEVEAALVLFQQQRPAIYELYRSQVGLDSAQLRITTEYLDEFYEVIGDSAEVTAEFMEKCIPL